MMLQLCLLTCSSDCRKGQDLEVFALFQLQPLHILPNILANKNSRGGQNASEQL